MFGRYFLVSFVFGIGCLFYERLSLKLLVCEVSSPERLRRETVSFVVRLSTIVRLLSFVFFLVVFRACRVFYFFLVPGLKGVLSNSNNVILF